MISLWNENMKEVYVPSWVSCLDESMSIWMTKFTCPGWVFCPRKPHPFGNEYHSICDGLSNIMYAIEIVEGRDAPPQIGQREHEDKGPTVGLLMRLCENLYNTGKVVILDSGFCVLEGLVELRKVGVFASAVIKKRRYWPKHVPGDEINRIMNDKELGATDSVKGTLKDVEYNIFCMKDKDWVMKMMCTYGGLQNISDMKKTYRWIKGNNQSPARSVSFKYKEPFANHYNYRHCVDDHNNLRHSVPSIEGSIVTQRWVMRVFCFILAISEVNAFLAMRFFVWKDGYSLSLHEFRRKLALSLMNNDYMSNERKVEREKKKRKCNDENVENMHKLLGAPPHAKKFTIHGWDLSCQARYQQYTCKMARCTNKTRTYCNCMPGHWICKSCHSIHIIEKVREDLAGD